MKTASSGMQTHLQSDCMTVARLYKITRRDGEIFTFTDHDQDISYGGYTYLPAVGFSPTAQQNKSDMTVDNQEASAFIDSEIITEKDLRFGIWDAAEIEIRLVNWANLVDGEVKLRKGNLGIVTMKNGVMTAEVLGLTNRLQIIIGRTFGPACDAQLGDSRCQAVVPTENGSVAIDPSIGPNDAHHITPNAGLTATVGYFDDGVVTFTSGVNSGLSFQVGTWDGVTATIKNALFSAPSNGDTFTIMPGCAHDIDDCLNKFNNLVNYRGFPKMPGQDAILDYPDATGG